jgi:uncharacterized DUF497 family protein
MRITFDPVKRKKTLATRGLAFEDAALVFEGVTLEVEEESQCPRKSACRAAP